MTMVVVGCISGGFLAWNWPDERLRVVVCDVEQGDSSLIFRSFSQVVIDGGPSDALLACVGRHLPFWDRKIEVVVLTHPQLDHYGGLVELLRRYQVGLLVANGMTSDADSFGELVELVRGHGVKVFVPERGDRLKIGGYELEVLWPEDEVGSVQAWQEEETTSAYSAQNLGIEDPNQASVVVEMTYGEFKGLFTGDISTVEEEVMVEKRVLEPVSVLKVAHHGSKYSSSSEFLERVVPRVAVVSVGARNRFGHPAKETLERLEAEGTEVRRTDQEGDVVLVTDGVRFWVEE